MFTVVQQTFELPINLPVAVAGSTDASGPDIVVTASTIRGAGVTSDGPQTVLTQREISRVASVNRDVRALERRDPFATQDLSNSSVGAVSFAGVNPRFNRFTINGVTVGDSFGLNPDASPTGRGPVPFDAIGQFSVSIAPYDFRQSGFQGGAIDTVLLSGTNQFHGTGFYSESRDELQGDRIGSNRVVLPNYNSRTYGATLRGPILRDRLFFMVSAERNTDPRPFTVANQSQVPGFTANSAAIGNVLSTANSLYGYNPGGFLTVNPQKDEKIVGRIDWNITTGQRLSLSYINAFDSLDIASSTSTSTSTPAIGYESNYYSLTELLRAGIAQLNSDWGGGFSTEGRFIYRSSTRGQDPLLGRGAAQFGVCVDPTSVGSNTSCTTGVPRVFFGPDISRQTNTLFTDTWAGSLLGRYQAGRHQVSLLAEFSENRTSNNFLQYSSGGYYFDSLASYNGRNADQLIYAATLNGQPNGAAAEFTYDQWTFGLQDEWRPTDSLTVSIGARYDLYGMRDVPTLNPFFQQRYGFTNQQTYKGLGAFQPRLSVNWQPTRALRIRGGVGVFNGGSPDIYLSNSFSNTILSNRVTFTRAAITAANPNGCIANAGTPSAAVCAAALNGVNINQTNPLVQQYAQQNAAALASSSTGALAPGFRLPSLVKATLSADYTWHGWNFGADYYYSNTQNGLTFVDLRSVRTGTLPDGRPRYSSLTTFNDSNLDIELANTSRGHSNIGVVRFNKQFDFGLNVGGSYTRQWVRDVSSATSSTITSNYTNQDFLDPNNPQYGISNDETTWSFKYSLGFDHAFFGDYRTVVQLFGETRSGRRYSYTMFDPVSTARSAVFGTALNSSTSRYLMYVPTSTTDPIVSYDSAATQTAVDNLINNTTLRNYRGQIAPKNIARSRAFTRIDLHLEQEIPLGFYHARLSVFGDIENLPNLINHNWGGLRQLGFPYQASTVQVQCLNVAVPTGTPVGNIGAAAPAGGVAAVNTTSSQTCAQYRYSTYRDPNESAISASNSLYLIRVGVRVTF